MVLFNLFLFLVCFVLFLSCFVCFLVVVQYTIGYFVVSHNCFLYLFIYLFIYLFNLVYGFNEDRP